MRTTAQPAADRIGAGHQRGDRPHGGRLVARRYRLRQRLGGGGMSVVWSADDEILRRSVAVKEMTCAEGYDDAFAMILYEARAAARIDHPGVVRVYDVVVDERPWLVMELLPGTTLAHLVRRQGSLAPDRAARIGLRLAHALQALHHAGIVHGDVKPANVQLCGGERVVLTDFGIAAAAEQPRHPSDMIVGSPAYISPERVGGGQLAPAADVFSLGVTLYAMVEGCPPFDNSSAATSLAAVVHDPPRPFRRSGALRPVIEGMLAKDPAERLRLDQVWLALDGLRRHVPPGAERR